jgi:hypothetical protein
MWRGDSQEVFFSTNDGRLMACDVSERGHELEVGTPKFLFNINVSAFGVPYDVSADGKRFLLNRAEEEGQVPLNLVVNWTSELKK